jgi:hypothetical protein
MEYSKEQFESAFQLITAVSHQIIKIDFQAVEVWIDKIMSAKAVTDEGSKENMLNLKQVMQQYKVMQDTLLNSGVPVRNIANYKKGAQQ